MAGSLPARLSASEGRKFGLTVGLAFVALALVAWWRGGDTAMKVLLGAGLLLIAAGLVVPMYLGPVQRGWMRFALAISKVTTPIVMGVIYFVLFTPVGAVRRLLGKNSLVRRLGAPELATGGYWVERKPGKRRGDLSRQY